MAANKIDLIRQALNASESSIKLARQLLGELENESRRGGVKNKAKELPGIVGMFDGKDMVTESGERHPVPENYASKSILVVGDTLKLAESGGEKKFKQIEHVKRHKTSGIIAKKDGKWTAVTPEGSYKLLAAAVEHFGADVGDEVLIQLPANNLQTTWAAVEKVTKKSGNKEGTSEGVPNPAEKAEGTVESKPKAEKQQPKAQEKKATETKSTVKEVSGETTAAKTTKQAQEKLSPAGIKASSTKPVEETPAETPKEEKQGEESVSNEPSEDELR